MMPDAGDLRILRALILFFCLYFSRGVDSLRCYSCHYEDVEEACHENEVTCQWGEVCINTVYRRQQYNGVTVIRSKGCKLRKECKAVQALNEDSYCASTPSECVYCCDSDYCNTAPSHMVSFVPVISAALIAMMLTRLTHQS